MAKLRRNHRSQKSGTNIFRLALYAFLLLGLLVYGIHKLNLYDISPSPVKKTVIANDGNRYFLPSPVLGEIVHHQYYSCSYAEAHEQSEWVAYELTEENLRIPNVDRGHRYKADPYIPGKSAVHGDYSGSGYSRGHLAPAGDMAQNNLSMEESFFMSNMSPQLRPFNNGIWKELEETVRDWAFHNDRIYVITGPVLTTGIIKKIGRNKVSVPSYFYKIVLDIEPPEEKAIAFLIPHARSEQPLYDYIVSIDSIEQITGIDFFPDLLNDDLEYKLESSKTKDGWKFSEKRYKLRVNKWNFE